MQINKCWNVSSYWHYNKCKKWDIWKQQTSGKLRYGKYTEKTPIMEKCKEGARILQNSV